MTSLTKSSPTTYANPSWTMAIASQSSALSRWWGKNLNQIDTFTLQLKPPESLDLEAESDAEPQSESARPITVQGNQAQLEMLSQLTETYVQSLLSRSLQLVTPGGGIEPSEDAELEDAPKQGVVFLNDPPKWKAQSAYSHQLYLGALQGDPAHKELSVSTSQLYDLAEILHQSLENAQPLPTDGYARVLPERSVSWRKTAAVAAIAVGITGGAFYFGRDSVFQTASEAEREEIALNQPQDQNLRPPDLNFPIETPAPPSPSPNAKASDTQKNVTGSQKKSATQESDITAAPDASEPKKTTTANSGSASQKLGQSSSSAKPEKQTGTQKKQPSTSQKKSSPTPKPATQIAKGVKPASEPTLGDAAKPEPTVQEKSPKPSSPKAKPKQDLVAGKPESLSNETSLKAANRTAPTGVLSSSGQAPKAAQPEPEAGSGQFSEAPAADIAAASAPPPPAAVVAPVEPPAPPPSARQATVSSQAVVESYFRSQWTGQDGLPNSLDYTLMVKPDGAVQSVTPKNELALDNLSSAPLPELGQPFTPPFAGEIPQSYDVKLYPDGSVAVQQVEVP